MSDRPTPETDAAIKAAGGEWSYYLGKCSRKLERERDEARREQSSIQCAFEESQDKIEKLERERDEAREELENVKLQLRLWEDGNLICEETLGEIRLLKEQIDRVLLERNEAHKIAERAIDDLAWFNETNAQRLRNELDQIKGGREMSDTPDTDTFFSKRESWNSSMLAFCLKMERERNDARKETNNHYVNYLGARYMANELADIASKYLSFLLAITPANTNQQHEKETMKVIDALKRWKKL
jgi:chromosome segregation ATPase